MTSGVNNSFSSPQPIAAADTNKNVEKSQAASEKTNQAFTGIATSTVQQGSSIGQAAAKGGGGGGGGDVPNPSDAAADTDTAIA